MVRNVTVVVKTDGADGKTAGVELRTGTAEWRKYEPGSADHVFKTQKGKYRFVGAGGSGDTELLGASSIRVGMLDSFNPLTVQDHATGQGLSDDAGRSLTWKVDGISDI